MIKVYKYGSEPCMVNDLLIVTEEDIRIVTVGLKEVSEKICTVYKNDKTGYSRLLFGNGSSFPYKNPDGTLNAKWVEVNVNNEK